MEKRRKLAFFCIGMAICGSMAVGCGKNARFEDTETQTEIEVTSEKTTENKDQPENEVKTGDSVAENVNALGYLLFEKLCGDENLCISPYSIEIALAMAANGAGGNTLTEMLEVLHIQDLDKFNNDICYSMSQLEKDGAELAIADSLWYNEAKKYNDTFDTEYVPVLQNYYGADVYSADFSSNATVENMNQWVSTATNGKIDQIIDMLKPDTRLVLFNAVYFKGDWAQSFNERNTYTQDFYGTRGTQSVDMMHMYGAEFQYCADYGIRVLRLQYENSNLVMDILIKENPEEAGTITELYNALSAEEKENLAQEISDGEYMSIFLALPVFEFESETMVLNDTLQSLGMKEAFGASANLDRIAEETYISEVCHKTYIKVDEQGTEAAAVTAVLENDAAACYVETLDFIVDTPFIYMIKDCTDDTILFMGNMNYIE